MPLNPQDLEQFMNVARVKLPGASDAGIKMEFYEVCKEFLADSNSWVEHFHLPVTVGQQEYLLTPRYGGQIIRLSGVFDGNRIPVRAVMPHFGQLHILWPINISSIVPAEGAPFTLNSTNPYLVVVVKNVTNPTTKDNQPVVPDFLLKVYSEHVIDGLLGRMMAQLSKSYSNVAQSKYHLQRFRAGIQIAKKAALNQNVQGAQNWSYPSSFRTRTQRGGMVTAWPPETF